MFTKEQESVPKKLEFTRFPGYYLLNIEEASLALFSVFLVSSYTFYASQDSSWIPGLDNVSMALVYLALSFFGFATNIILTLLTNRRVRAEGLVHVSFTRALFLYAPPFVIPVAPGGALLTIALGGNNGFSLILGIMVLYGFVIGFLMGRIVSKIINLRSWCATQVERDTKTSRFRDVIISYNNSDC